MWTTVFAVVALVACAHEPKPVQPAPTPAAKPVASAEPEAPVPPYLQQFPGLYVRKGDQIVDAPAADVAVAKGYARSKDKGPIVEGHRLTLLTARTRVHVGEEVRVIHVHEVVVPNETVFVMGPKAIRGETLDGKLVTPTVLADEDPFQPSIYDGATVESPAADYNWEITSYRFSSPGTHVLQWRLGKVTSNALAIEVVP